MASDFCMAIPFEKEGVSWVPLSNLLDEKLSTGIYVPVGERGQGHPLIDTGEMFANEVMNGSECEQYIPLTESQAMKHTLRKGDLLFARKSTASEAGKVSIYVGERTDITYSGDVIRARVKSDVDPWYLFGFFNSKLGEVLMSLISEKTASSGIRSSDLAKFPIPIFDSKLMKLSSEFSRLNQAVIQNNISVNNCLNELITRLFRSWFIDFDPVKAKSEGKLPYGMDEETSALFPDTLEDSELGPIPTGWKVGRIGDISNISSGKHQPKRSEEKNLEFEIPLLGGAGIIAWTTESLFDEPIIVIGRVGTLGVVKKYTSPVWPSDNTLIFKTNCNSSFHYLLHQLKLQDFGAYNRGSTQPLLTQSDMKKLKIIIPNEDVLFAFEEKIRSMTLLSAVLEEQSRFLTKTKDALLPRLMSGELSVC